MTEVSSASTSMTAPAPGGLGAVVARGQHRDRGQHRHHEREERDILPRYVAGLNLSQRKELGRQWCAFMATRQFDGHGRGRERGYGGEEG